MNAVLLGLIAAISFTSIVRTSVSPVVTARVKGPMGLTIDAVSHEVYAKNDGKNTTVVVPVSSFKTGIDLRDKHMMEAVESFQYPVAVLTISNEEMQKDKLDFSGEISFHGEKKKIEVHCVRDSSTYVVNFQLDLRDFQVKMPSYAGVTVKPAVQVTASVDVVR